MTRESDLPDFHAPEDQPPDVSGEKTKAELVKDQAGQLGGTAMESGGDVASTAKEEATKVAAEAASQARDLLDQARTEVEGQTREQQQRAAGSIRSLSDGLRSMADSAEQPGVATDLARDASQRADTFAQWLEEHEPGDLVDAAKTFARQRPGMFLAIAAGAGVLAGRLARGLKEGPASSSTSSNAPVPQPAAAMPELDPRLSPAGDLRRQGEPQ